MARVRHKEVSAWSWSTATAEQKQKFSGRGEVKPFTQRDSGIAELIGLELRKARMEMDLSAAESGTLLGLSQAQVSYYENGNDSISLSMLHEFADVYSLDLIRLFISVEDVSNLSDERRLVVDTHVDQIKPLRKFGKGNIQSKSKKSATRLARRRVSAWSWSTATTEQKQEFVARGGVKPFTQRDSLIAELIGLELRKARIAKGLSTAEAGSLLGLSQTQVTYYENADHSISLSLIHEFSDIYCIDVIRLFISIEKIAFLSSERRRVVDARIKQIKALRKPRGNYPSLTVPQILDISLRLKDDKVTIRMIAEEFSLRTNTLYCYFSSNGDLRPRAQRRIAIR